MAVEGDLTSSTQLEVKKHGSLLLVDDIKFANFKLDGRSAATEHVPQYLLQYLPQYLPRFIEDGFCLECSDAHNKDKGFNWSWAVHWHVF